MAASQAIDITLRCSDHLDEYSTRAFTLRPGHVVQIGRASKNASKPELMIGPDNAFIDSPTISREHAVLTATSPPAASVYITDKASMHGTMVNGTKLEPQKAYRLNNGDVLQFGANVTRELLFYTARQFTFESSLSSYPHGINVPDSSDDEEVEVDQGMRCPPHYGTQTNPVTIDDVEESHLSEDDALAETRSVGDRASKVDEFGHDELDKDLQDASISLDGVQVAQERSPSPDDTHHVFYAEDVTTTFPAPTRYAFVEDISSEGDASPIYSSDDEQVSHVGSCASMADSDESQSEGDMELEDHDEEDGEERADVPLLPSKLQLKLPEQYHKQYIPVLAQARASQQNESEARGSLPSDSVAFEMKGNSVGSSTKTGTSFCSDSSELGLTTPPAPFAHSVADMQTATEAEASKIADPELRFEQLFPSAGVFSDSYDRTCFENMEAIPPRPAAPRPMQWGMLDYTSPFSPPTSGPGFDYLGNYPGPVEPLLPNPYAAQQPYIATPENTWGPSKNSLAAPVPRMQTPPPAPSSEISSPPARRTEVSIREIVEDVIQQPQTPTSVTGGLKRKADVLDEVSEGSSEEPTPAPQSSSSIVALDAPAVEIANHSQSALDQRPKKQMRSRLGSAARTAAAWVVPGVVGAAASVAFLTSVPNDFFVA